MQVGCFEVVQTSSEMNGVECHDGFETLIADKSIDVLVHEKHEPSRANPNSRL